MAQDVEIQCIHKADRTNPHRHITHVGGVHAGSRWILPEDDAIAGIDEGKWQFYVSVGGRRVNVIVEKSQQGHRFLKTVADGYVPNNLLSLPDCPR